MTILAKHNVLVELLPIDADWIDGFGECDDPDGKRLRFTVYLNGEPVPNGMSYCTDLTNDLTDREKKRAVQKIMRAVYEPLSQGQRCGSLCERLSKLSDNDVKEW